MDSCAGGLACAEGFTLVDLDTDSPSQLNVVAPCVSKVSKIQQKRKNKVYRSLTLGTLRPHVTAFFLLKAQYATHILQGTKKFEVRAASSASARRVCQGCFIGFHWCSPRQIVCRVASVLCFSSIEHMVAELGPSNVMPGSLNEQHCCESWRLCLGQVGAKSMDFGDI